MEEEGRTEVVQKKFTVKGLESVFSKINSVLLELEAMDLNVEHFTNVERQTNELF